LPAQHTAITRPEIVKSLAPVTSQRIIASYPLRK
jgi:hypothetical protein